MSLSALAIISGLSCLVIGAAGMLDLYRTRRAGDGTSLGMGALLGIVVLISVAILVVTGAS